MRDAAVIEQLAGSRPITRLTHARQRTSGVVGVLWCDATAIAICAHHCQLARLPGAIGELPGLERLDVGDNQLTELPALPECLRELYIYDNQLVRLPELPALRVLDACKCSPCAHWKCSPCAHWKCSPCAHWKCSPRAFPQRSA